jgi:hypothetical protein
LQRFLDGDNENMCNNKMALYVVSVVESMRTKHWPQHEQNSSAMQCTYHTHPGLSMHLCMSHQTINEDASKHEQQIEADANPVMFLAVCMRTNIILHWTLNDGAA